MYEIFQALLIGAVIGAALMLYAVRRYRNRDGKIAELVRWATGDIKGKE